VKVAAVLIKAHTEYEEVYSLIVESLIVESLTEMREAIATYTAQAAVKLRNEHGVTGEISIFIMTNPFEQHAPSYSHSTSIRLPFPISFTPDLVRTALTLLDSIYRSGLRYKRVGVSLMRISSEDILQPDLFGAYRFEEEAKKTRLMAVVDIVNDSLGRGSLFLAVQGQERSWEHHPQWISRHASTRWNELIPVT
jgi:DNA polymerase V